MSDDFGREVASIAANDICARFGIDGIEDGLDEILSVVLRRSLDQREVCETWTWSHLLLEYFDPMWYMRDMDR